MSTSYTGYQSSGGGGLPVPHIVLAGPLSAGQGHNPNSVDYTWTAADEQMFMRNMPLFTAKDFPASLLEQDLRLELLIYRKETSRQNTGAAKGFRHPAHSPTGAVADDPTGGAPPASVLPPSRYINAVNNGTVAGVPFVPYRQTTEWSVTAIGQKFFIANLGQFYFREDVDFRDPTGGIQSVKAFVPRNKAVKRRNAGSRYFGYSHRFADLLFTFRFSIADPDDSRARLSGPETRVIRMGNTFFPFVQDLSEIYTATDTRNIIDQNYQYHNFNCGFGFRTHG